jgi:hypothetical protein
VIKKISKIHAFVPILSLLLLCSCATERVSQRQLPADTVINEDAGRGSLLFVNLRLKNGEELPFIVDTGSPGTLFDKSLMPKLGARLPLGTWTVPMNGEKQKSGIYWEPELYLGKTRLKTGRLCAVFDLTQFAKQVGHPVMGILAMDCLKYYCIQLDFQADKMRFLDPKGLDVAALGKPFPLKFSLYNQLFTDHAGLVKGKSTRLLIDTGWDGDGEIEKGVIKGSNSGWVHLQECDWAGETYTNLNVRTGGNIIGLGFLARHLVTFDFPKRVMYLKQTSTGPLIDERLEAALNCLRDLRGKGRLPGWLKSEKGSMRLEAKPDANVFQFVGQKSGNQSNYHYIVARMAEDSPWKLQRAWQTDQNDKTIEEYPVP